MARHELTLPDYLPHKLNDLLRMHWAVRGRALKAEAALVAIYATQQAVPKAEGKRRVSVTFQAPGGRGAKTGDADGRLKGLLDACVKCGLLVDDSPTWLELGAVVCVKAKPKQTVVVLEDV